MKKISVLISGPESPDRRTIAHLINNALEEHGFEVEVQDTVELPYDWQEMEESIDRLTLLAAKESSIEIKMETSKSTNEGKSCKLISEGAYKPCGCKGCFSEQLDRWVSQYKENKDLQEGWINQWQGEWATHWQGAHGLSCTCLSCKGS